MNTYTIGRKAVFGGLALGIACIFALGTGSASASEYGGRGNIGVNIGIGNNRGYDRGYHGTPQYIYGNGYSRYGGHYNGGFGNLYIGSYDYYTPAPRVWVDGYYETQYYGDRRAQVWHPGCYRN